MLVGAAMSTVILAWVAITLGLQVVNYGRLVRPQRPQAHKHDVTCLCRQARVERDIPEAVGENARSSFVAMVPLLQAMAKSMPTFPDDPPARAVLVAAEKLSGFLAVREQRHGLERNREAAQRQKLRNALPAHGVRGPVPRAPLQD